MKKLWSKWSNRFEWLLKELVNIGSEKKSFFSKKRIESGIAFLVAQWGMIYFLYENHSKLSATDIVMWAAAEFAVAGYMINHIQKEKKPNSNNDSPDE